MRRMPLCSQRSASRTDRKFWMRASGIMGVGLRAASTLHRILKGICVRVCTGC